MSNEQTTDICGTSLGVGWWCVKPIGHAPPCCDAVHAVEIAYRRRDTAQEVLKVEVAKLRERLATTEAEVASERLQATSYREELLQIVSYLGHFDQDANHAWMVRRVRAVLAGKNPNTVEGWTMHDGVPAPVAAPTKVVGTGYSPPKELWFHFHPAPHMVAPDGEERLAASGDLWHDPFETAAEAEAALGENAVQGWVVVGPYTYEVGAIDQMADDAARR